MLEHLAALRDRRERRAHASGADHENLHRRQSDANRTRAGSTRRGRPMRRNGSGASRMLRRSECPPKTARREHRSAQPRQQPSRPPPPPGRCRPRAPSPRADPPAPPGGPVPAGETAPGAGRPRRRSARASWCSSRSAAVLLAILTTWPLVLHMPSRISPDLGDPVRTAWEVAWVGHAMLHSPLHIFDCERLLPPSAEPRVLGLAARLRPDRAARVGHRRRARPLQPAVPVRVRRCASFGALPAGARARARASSGRPPPGIAFAYAPYRVTEAGHLHVISSGGIPLALFLLLRGYRRGSVPTRARGLARVRLAGEPRLHARPAVRLPAGDPRRDRRARLVARVARPIPTVTRALLIATVLGAGVLGAVTIYQARPYLRVSHLLPDRQAHDQGSRELLLRARRARLGVLREPRLGQRHLRCPRPRPLQERGRVLPRRSDPGARRARGCSASAARR